MQHYQAQLGSELYLMRCIFLGITPLRGALSLGAAQKMREEIARSLLDILDIETKEIKQLNCIITNLCFKLNRVHKFSLK